MDSPTDPLEASLSVEHFVVVKETRIRTRKWNANRSNEINVKLAFVAHPLGLLGGSWDDHVVAGLSRYLLMSGWDVVQFNSRGIGGSSGWASLSATQDSADFQAVAEDHVLRTVKEMSEANQTVPLDILICGYSAGASSASMIDSKDIKALCSHSTSPSRLRHLLVSYPLSVLWALTLFRSSTFKCSLEKMVQSSEANVLAIHGTRDNFTAIGKYLTWSQTLEKTAASGNGGRFKAVVVQEADHFWTRGSMRKLISAVDEWLNS